MQSWQWREIPSPSAPVSTAIEYPAKTALIDFLTIVAIYWNDTLLPLQMNINSIKNNPYINAL
jgi:hypothetical protein